MSRAPVDAVVLVSGQGTNLQAIINAVEASRLDLRIVDVISNRADANGLQRAARHGIPTIIVDQRHYAAREDFDKALLDTINAAKPELVVLAGYMRILDDTFVEHYAGRLLNIHPSLLPKYPGLGTHARAIANGDSLHGCSVHFVTAELDGGPVIARSAVAVHAGDDVATLSARVHLAEHKLYPEVIKWFVAGRLQLIDGNATLDGKPMPEPTDLAFDAIAATG